MLTLNSKCKAPNALVIKNRQKPKPALQPFAFSDLYSFLGGSLFIAAVSYVCTGVSQTLFPLRQKYVFFSTMLLAIIANGFLLFLLHDLSQDLPTVHLKAKATADAYHTFFY